MVLKSKGKEKVDKLYFHILKDLQLGNMETAEVQLKQLEKMEGATARVEDLHGVFQFLLGNLGAAESFFKKALKLAPEKKEYRLNLGNLYVAQNEWDKAREAFQQIHDKNPGYFPALHNLSMALIRTDNPDGALALIEKMKALEPNFPGNYRMESLIYYDRGDYEKALIAADRNLQLDPNNPETFVQLGEIFNRMNRGGDAIMAFERAVRLNPESTDNLISLALAYGNEKRFDDALPILLKAEKNAPGNSSVLEGLSLIYKLQGNDALASQYEKKAAAAKDKVPE